MAPTALDLFNATHASTFRALWLSPVDKSGMRTKTLVAIGESVSFEANPELLKGFPSDTEFIGGAPFVKPDVHLYPKWKNFQNSKMVLPRLLISYSSKNTASVQIAAEDETEKEMLIKELEGLIQQVNSAAKKMCKATSHLGKIGPQKNTAPLTKAHISSAISEIRNQKKPLEKVVLADCKSFDVGDIGDIEDASASLPELLIKELTDRYLSCTIFAFSFNGPESSESNESNEEIFFGATPELLLKVKAEQFETTALAGSEKINPANPDSKFTHNPKELAEHQFVVNQLIQKMTALGAVLEPVPKTPEIRELPGIKHLQTSIVGQLPSKQHILNCINQLSPTSAVAGIPTESALEFIKDIESFNRGWYGGPVGWCNLGGDGEFFVALRSALFTSVSKSNSSSETDSPIGSSSQGQLYLFAGAGIVADSKPEHELEEIELKINAIKSMLPFNES